MNDIRTVIVTAWLWYCLPPEN